MRRTLEIWPSEPKQSDGKIVISALIEQPRKERVVLWYELPERFEPSIAPDANALTVGCLHLAMQAGLDARIHGRVAPSLLRNLAEYQHAWSSWRNDLSFVDIAADEEWERQPERTVRGSVVAFSGGVDSCFSTFRHTRGAGRRPAWRLEAGVMVHGFDIPLEEPGTFASAFERSKRMLSSLGLEAVPVATNYREVQAEWTSSYGAAVASCLMLLARRYRAGFIGQGLAYGHFRHMDEGSNPLTDAMLSSDSFAVIPDGGGYLRADKIRAMADWPEFLDNLRVCWEGPQKDRNCCRCEKCIRNILTFRALGMDRPPCFERDVTIDQIRKLTRLKEITMLTQYDNIVRLACDGRRPSRWAVALRRRIARNRRTHAAVAVRTYRRIRYCLLRACAHPGLALRWLANRVTGGRVRYSVSPR